MKGTSKVQWKMRKGEFVCVWNWLNSKKGLKRGAMHFHRKALGKVKSPCLSLTAQLYKRQPLNIKMRAFSFNKRTTIKKTSKSPIKLKRF